MRIKLGIFLLMLTFAACTSDNAEDLFGSQDCISEGATFSNDVQKILTNHCLSCHSSVASNIVGGGIVLEGYSAVKLWADSGNLLGSIRWDAGFSQMPKNGNKIPACDIEKVANWISQGAPNN